MSLGRRQSSAEQKDKAVVIYHVVYRHETFEKAAQALFEVVKDVEQRYPGKSRIFMLDIEGHRNKQGGFDADMHELQKDFVLGFLMPFLTEVSVQRFRYRSAVAFATLSRNETRFLIQ
jgi:hypothetical protein